MYLGAHVSSAGGIENAVKAAKKFEINSIQMMPTAPMRWATEEIEQEDIENFVNELEGEKWDENEAVDWANGILESSTERDSEFSIGRR